MTDLGRYSTGDADEKQLIPCLLRQYEVPWPWRWHVQSYPILVSLRYETGRIFQNPRNKNTLERKTWKIVDNFGNFKNNQIENDPLLCGKTPLLARIREQ